jgi:hypothetical protein
MRTAKPAWTPTENVTGHARQLLEPNLVFYIPPPPEIGYISNAYSTLEVGKPTTQWQWSHVLGLLFGGVFLAFGTAFLARSIFSLISPEFGLLAGIGSATVILWLMFRDGLTVPVECSYVGEKGVARFIWNKRPQPVNGTGVFLFEEAQDLQIQQTRHYRNGIYQNTSYSFDWYNSNAKRVFVIGGSHYRQDGQPPVEDKYHFGMTAEQAWSVFALERARSSLANSGTVSFRLGGKNELIVGSGFLEIVQNGQRAKISTEEIGRVTISQGVVTVRRKDAKAGFFGIGSSGIFNFNYKDIANAKLFITLFDALVGVDVN